MDNNEKIVKAAISSLIKEGVSFSVDSLSKTMRMSKKTIYASFHAKSELALAIYAHLKDNFTLSLDKLDLDSSFYAYALYLYLSREEIIRRFSFSRPLIKKIRTDKDEIFFLFYSAFLKDKNGLKETWRLILEASLPEIFKSSTPIKAVKDFTEVLFK
ncbi:MAG: hypothetical protein LKJ88_05045 [Bacilli bacterium]|jgi:AcrR family transcriptional regulator|nr:hypothetical protein [Bacilli bacterium]